MVRIRYRRERAGCRWMGAQYGGVPAPCSKRGSMRARETISHPIGCRCSTLDMNCELVPFALRLRETEGLDRGPRNSNVLGCGEHGTAPGVGYWRGRRRGELGQSSRDSRAFPDSAALCGGIALPVASEIVPVVVKAIKSDVMRFVSQSFPQRPNRNFVAGAPGDELTETKGPRLRFVRWPGGQFLDTGKWVFSWIPVGSRPTPWPTYGTMLAGVLHICKLRVTARRRTAVHARLNVSLWRSAGRPQKILMVESVTEPTLSVRLRASTRPDFSGWYPLGANSAFSSGENSMAATKRNVARARSSRDSRISARPSKERTPTLRHCNKKGINCPARLNSFRAGPTRRGGIS